MGGVSLVKACRGSEEGGIWIYGGLDEGARERGMKLRESGLGVMSKAGW